MSGDASAEDPLPDVSIFKIVVDTKMESYVPKRVVDTKMESYVPKRVLLGPFHHPTKVLVVNSYKQRALRAMATRFNTTNATTNATTNDADFLLYAIQPILTKEREIRESYEYISDCDTGELAAMLCLDGCFILQVLKDLAEHGLNFDLINEVPSALNDILMLENQIPWIVLLQLLGLENQRYNVERTLLELMVKATCGLFISSEEDRTALLQLAWLDARKVHHFLDFVHKVIVLWPPNQANHRNQGDHKISIGMPADENEAVNHDVESIPRAVELKNAGIKFQRVSGGISNISFDPASSTIYLPLLPITYDNREVLLLNLIAFEMLKSSDINYVSSYVNLMGDLIKSQNDVDFLRSMDILTNTMVPDFFNGLLKGVTVKKPDICAELRKAVNTDYKNRCGYCKNTIRVQLAELWRDHFSSPCKALALAVASVALCLTIIQTIYTVKK